MFGTTTLTRDPADSWASSLGKSGGGIISALLGGEAMRQQAELKSMGNMAKIGQSNATARYANARAGLDENQLNAQQDPMQASLLELGLPTNLAPAFKNKLSTGSFGGGYDTPSVDGVGPVMPAPADDQTMAKLGRSMSLLQRITATGSNVSQGADAALKDQQMRQIDQVASNPAMAGAVGTAQAAGHGKALFNPTGNTGQSVQNMTGAAGPVNDVLANLFQLGEGAQVNQRNAAAANSFASAGQHGAQTQKIRQDIEMGGKGVIQQTDQGLMLVDPRSGTARPVTGADGATLAGKVKELNEGQAKDNLYASRMQEADGIISRLTGQYSPAAVNARMAVAEVPGVGMTANWLQSKEGQQAEQAQRDFINAVLRRESGAVISPGEFANAKLQYFPQANDKPENLKQKARNRQIAIEGVYGSVPVSRRGVPSLTNPAPGASKSGATGQWGETTTSAAPMPIKSDDDYNALPSGAVFTAPDGSQRRKP